MGRYASDIHNLFRDIQDKERSLEVARGAIAIQWEDKLLDEMGRLKMELEQIGLEDKHSALAKMKAEYEDELLELTAKFNSKQEELEKEISDLKQIIASKQKDYEALQERSDSQIVEARMFVERAERENQAVLDTEIAKRESIIGETEHCI